MARSGSTALACSLLLLAVFFGPSQARSLSGLQLLQDSSPPDPTKPCVGSNTGSYMTAVSKCPKDVFFVSFVRFGSTSSAAYAYGAATADPVTGTTKHRWVGPNLGGEAQAQNPQMYVAVLRASDGKVIVPKGVAADGVTPVDISSTKRRVCQLFKQSSNPLSFAAFRARLNPDGSKIIRNDFGKKPDVYPEGLECEKYSEVLVGEGSTTAVGRLTDMYQPRGCMFVIDDCSK